MRLKLSTPEVFRPLDAPARYKGAWGGRGSGKSHYFAERIIIRSITSPGHRTVCVREFQNSLRESSKRLIEDKLNQLSIGEAQGFVVQSDRIITPGDGVIVFVGMQDANAENIKSLEGYDVAWVEEAQTLSARSLDLLRPTIRKDGSELWFSWNARRKTDPVDKLLRPVDNSLPTNAVVVKSNWRDNPFFPAVLEQERKDCRRIQPDQYEHIWEGAYASVLVGAYYAAALTQARADGRIGRVAPDPLLPINTFWDIGGTGARADACAIWAIQQVGRELRVLDYYEARGQELAVHVAWLREKGYERGTCYLPHDGVQSDKVYAVSYESSLKSAGFHVEVVKNQGAGAAMQRINSARRMFGQCWFNERTTHGGIDALGWYHERTDDTRQIGLGPEHDFSSHGADAFGLACTVAEHKQSDSGWSNDIFVGNRKKPDITGYSRARMAA